MYDVQWVMRYIPQFRSTLWDYNGARADPRTALVALFATEEAIQTFKDFTCLHCGGRFKHTYEDKRVPEEIMSRYVELRCGTSATGAFPVCRACTSKCYDADGNLSITTANQCGLCGRDELNTNLRIPEDALLDPPVDDYDAREFQFTEPELAWLRMCAHRHHDFWCGSCIAQTAYCMRDALPLIREAAMRDF